MATINNDNNSNKNLHGDPDGEYEGTHDSVPNGTYREYAWEQRHAWSARDKYSTAAGGSAKRFSKFDNFWYHNKWKGLLPLLIIVISVDTYQILTREKAIFLFYTQDLIMSAAIHNRI